MTEYVTIYNEICGIGNLTAKEKQFLQRVKKYYKRNPDWNEFANFWRKEIENVVKVKTKKETVDTVIYRICEDLEARIGIKQGYTGPADSRDLLEELIYANFSSRYRSSKKGKKMVKIRINSKQRGKGLLKLIDSGGLVGITEDIFGVSAQQLKVLDKEKIKYCILDEQEVNKALNAAKKAASKFWERKD